ncbi:winged helix-turn-helix domain-containing protein [Colwellia psychrerythraea]|uniref:Transcriptional regulator, CadC n=1 Tax=Colwellia psychrerythraea TaxID=28229 RepID=A0A099L359_COLPS|nr:winged helix-turn-helix domain-containing protein [Colwellia psychrerythraea]KGJ97399.1 transcriptional regulator, CadC [Colwellia psychrerythraea]
MSVYQFYEFQFNSEKYQLSIDDIKVSIRPKTALLLNYLIENRQVIVSKAELFEAVWQTTHVQNHTLFQVISEIRKLTNEDLVRTQPNRGYQWVAPTKEIIVEQCADTAPIELSNVKANALRKNSFQYLAMAASITMLACFSFYLGQWSTQQNDVLVKGDIAKGTNSLPAINAYAKGVVAFEKGHYSQAKQWFDFSLLEDPSSVQSKLMLAESYFKQKNYTRAQDVAFKLLDSLNKSSYHYSSAADLMSRMYAQQGLVFDALNYAITGANSLENSASFCSIEVSEQRIGRLVQRLIDDKGLQTDKEKLLAGYYKQTVQSEPSAAASEKKLSTADILCEQVNKMTESKEVLSDDVSACLKQESTPWLLSYNYLNKRKVINS